MIRLKARRPDQPSSANTLSLSGRAVPFVSAKTPPKSRQDPKGRIVQRKYKKKGEKKNSRPRTFEKEGWLDYFKTHGNILICLKLNFNVCTFFNSIVLTCMLFDYI